MKEKTDVHDDAIIQYFLITITAEEKERKDRTGNG